MSFQSSPIAIENFFEAIVVGGGTCGLAVAARLCEDTPGSIFTEDEHQRYHWLRQRKSKLGIVSKDCSKLSLFRLKTKLDASQILVLDAVADTFMGQWDNQFASCQIPVLRSPMFFHPDPVNIDGMISYAFHNKRDKDLVEIHNVVGKEYSKHQQKRVLKKQSKKNPTPLVGESNHDRPGVIDINMRDYRDYYRPSTNFFHDFCADLVERYNLGSRVRNDEVMSIDYGEILVNTQNLPIQGFTITTKSGQVYGARNCVVCLGHRGRINYPLAGLKDKNATLAHSCHTTHIFSKQVEFPHPKLLEKRPNGMPAAITIVGGGLTSAQLAHLCCQKGIKTTLLLRGPIKIKHFDFHLDWVTKYKNLKKSSFYMLDTDEERLELIQSSREGGLVNPEYYKLLQKHVASGRLQLLKHTQIAHGQLVDGEWELELTQRMPKEEEQTIKMRSNYVCCATGILADVMGLGFLQPIVAKFPIELVGGFPCLTDDLQWHEQVPLFMAGKNASLRIGPTSANLDGARLGAERIGWKIQDSYTEEVEEDMELKLARGLFNWYSVLQEVAC